MSSDDTTPTKRAGSLVPGVGKCAGRVSSALSLAQPRGTLLARVCVCPLIPFIRPCSASFLGLSDVPPHGSSQDEEVTCSRCPP